MQVEVSFEALQHIVQQACNLGMIQYRNMVAPDSDKMKQREAQRYLQRLGFDPKILKDWVQFGYVRKRKDGERNSAVWYSLNEIQRQIVAVEMKKGITKYY